MSSSLRSLLGYLADSPSPYHAVASAQHVLAGVGFRQLDEHDPWHDVSGRCFVIRGGALIAWVNSDVDLPKRGLRIVGAHTDSPNLRIKPRPDLSSAGWQQWGVEVYGGILANSWLDRDLGLSGRVVLRDGVVRLVRIDRALARVAQLAIHLDRDVNDRGLVLDRQLHLLPLIGLGDLEPGGFRELLSEELGVASDAVVSWDAMLHDLSAPALLGVGDEFIASARIDNLFSCWAAVTALVDAAEAAEASEVMASSGPLTMVALFDHEEIGSSSTTGAAGPLLEVVIDRICHASGVDVDGRARTVAASTCISADMAHAVHPNYADRHEPQHGPVPNGGPVVKVNVSQRYATDAVGAAAFTAACEAVAVPVQMFVSRNSQPCGSTIGPITSTRLGIATVDVGCAMLSMHSARELCGAQDGDLMRRALASYYVR